MLNFYLIHCTSFDCLLFLVQCRTTWVRCLLTMQQWCLTPLELQLLSSLERVSWLSYWATIVLLAPYLLLQMSEFFLSLFSYWWKDLFKRKKIKLILCFDYFPLFGICSKINLKIFQFFGWVSATYRIFSLVTAWNFLVFGVLGFAENRFDESLLFQLLRSY